MASPETNFSAALTIWKDISLSDLQKTMDAQGLELVENQKDSTVGRKQLADKTREFKKIPEEEKGAAFKTLLKAYQTEIDSLTRRCKTSENAFLNVYKLLAEAPDPYPLLDAAVDQTVKVAEAQSLEAEVARLREENTELKSRLGEVSSLETAKRKADSRVEALETKMESMIAERVTAKENELNATYDERIMNFEERERDLQRQVALTKNQLRELQTSTESTQAKLFDHSERQDQEVVAKLAEMDMIVADLERSNSRVATVERRNELLRAEIESIRSGSASNDKVKALESQVTDLESESARLLRVLESQKSAAAQAESLLKKKTDETAKEMQSKAAEIDSLKQKIKKFSDYDEIKRELDIMKYVEFSGGDDGEGNEMGYDVHLPDPNADKATRNQGQSLENLLMAKNKRILDELTKFRILHGELEASLQSATQSLEQNKVELEKQRSLNEKLENDLLHINGPRKLNGDRLSESATPNGLGLSTDESTSDLLNGLNGLKSEPGVRASPIPFAAAPDTSILPIVTSQRDRFRQRNAELEEELRKQFEIISELRTEIKSLQADNMKLYEKVRYMQSYRDNASSSTSTFMSTSAAPVSSGRDDMGKYQNMYEQSMNPFEAFRGREAARAVQSLNPLERGVFVLTRQILGNRRARTAFIVYAVILHALVLFTTYECASNGSNAPHLSKPMA